MGTWAEYKYGTYYVVLICPWFIGASADSHPPCVALALNQNGVNFFFEIYQISAWKRRLRFGLYTAMKWSRFLSLKNSFFITNTTSLAVKNLFLFFTILDFESSSVKAFLLNLFILIGKLARSAIILSWSKVSARWAEMSSFQHLSHEILFLFLDTF